MTSTLLVAIVIGILGVKISANVKSVFFLMFLFAVGYGVGPQFVRGIAKDGVPQAIFAVILAVLSLAASVAAAMIAGYDLGSAAGLFAGSQTISASMGLATDAINRLGRSPEETEAKLLDAMPIAYAVTYIFGTVGSAIIPAQIGPKLLGIDLVAACKDYEHLLGASEENAGMQCTTSSCAPTSWRPTRRTSARPWAMLESHTAGASARSSSVSGATARSSRRTRPRCCRPAMWWRLAASATS